MLARPAGDAATRAAGATIGRPTAAVVAGSGEFLARRLHRVDRAIWPDRRSQRGLGGSRFFGRMCLCTCKTCRRAVSTSRRPRMTSTVTSVVKVGGSLFGWTEFPCRMSAFLRTLAADRTAERIILIAGGGPAADVIREIDRIHQLGDQTAHRLALHAMELSAQDFGRACPPSPRPLRRGWPLLCMECRRNSDPGSVAGLAQIESSGHEVPPMSWDTTSDSIAARIAVSLAADRLILLKSAPLSPGTNRGDAARLGLVDPIFPVVARSLARVEYVNLARMPPHLNFC